MPAIALEADVATAAAILVTLGFGLFEYRRQRALRREAGAIEVIHSFQGPEFGRSLRLLFELPVDAPPEAIRGSQPREDAAYVVIMAFETIGVLVHRRFASLDVVEDVMGGAIVHVWQILRPWIDRLRAEQRRDAIAEWFQWLAERLEENRSDAKRLGAHVAFREWKPDA